MKTFAAIHIGSGDVSMKVYQMSKKSGIRRIEELKYYIELGSDIYTFPFSYRGGAEASTAFLLTNGATPYIFVGQEAQFDFIGLEEQGVLDEPEDEISIEDDELDFSMM